MSRYRPDRGPPEPRYSSGDLAYRDPPAQRWDRDSFARERDYRGPPTMEQRPQYDDPYRRPNRAPVYEKERYYEDDRYGPRGNLYERQIYEEDDYYGRDPRASGGAMIPFRPERPGRAEAPPRPGILRRQSSLDTFDRRPSRRYDDYDGGYRPAQPGRPPYAPDRYPDHHEHHHEPEFTEYREREWISKRRRSGSRSRSRDRGSVIEESREDIRTEKPYPRRGKTRMPKRLVHTKVLYDLGYPYYEEDERTILIERALGPHNIDEVFTLSKEYREREVGTTRLLEAPEIVHHPAETVREERFEEIQTVPIHEAPRSVREWDQLSVRSPSPQKSHRSRSRRRSRRGSSPGGTVRETYIEKEKIVREVSPARTHRTSHSHHHDHHDHHDHHSDHSDRERETVIEKTRIITEDDTFDESSSVHVGPLALVVDRKPNRSDRDIKDEIRRLERERKEIRRERRYDRGGVGGEIVKVERMRERSPSPQGEVIVRREGDEIVEVKKDRRVRSRSAAPTPGMIKAMMATLT